jgi:hypothetical protein
MDLVLMVALSTPDRDELLYVVSGTIEWVFDDGDENAGAWRRG